MRLFPASIEQDGISCAVGMRMPEQIRGFTWMLAGSQPRRLPSRAQCHSVVSVKKHRKTPFVLPMLRIRFTAPPPALLKASIHTVGPTALPHSSFKHHDVCRILSWCSPLMAVCLLIGACTATASIQRQRQAMVMAGCWHQQTRKLCLEVHTTCSVPANLCRSARQIRGGNMS